MRRRTQIVLAITFMVATLVTGASYLYISQILRQGINSAHDTASYLTSQLAYLATNAAPDLSSTRVDTSNPEALRRGIAYYLGTDRDHNTILDSVVGSWPTVYDAAILDSDEKAILDTDPNLVGKKIVGRPDFSELQRAGFRRKLRMVYNPPTVYDVHVPLVLNGQKFGSIHVGISTVFLRNELTPRLQRQLALSAIAVLCSLVLAAVLSHVALGPLEQINRSLDSMAPTNAADVAVASGGDAYGSVSFKIANLGPQMRAARELFSPLETHVDQLMTSLHD